MGHATYRDRSSLPVAARRKGRGCCKPRDYWFGISLAGGAPDCWAQIRGHSYLSSIAGIPSRQDGCRFARLTPGLAIRRGVRFCARLNVFIQGHVCFKTTFGTVFEIPKLPCPSSCDSSRLNCRWYSMCFCVSKARFLLHAPHGTSR